MTVGRTWVVCFLALATPLRAADDAVISGSVMGGGGRPIGGATVEVRDTPCRATADTDGSFSLPCSASGRHAVRASFGDLRPWQVEDVELGPGHTVYLNFLLLPEGAAVNALGEAASEAALWTRRLPNPVVGVCAGRAVTLRVVAIAAAALSFVLGAFTMVLLGRRFGVETRRLSDGEVGDLVLNPRTLSIGERVTPVAVAGARGASATVSYDADKIAAALADRRYGLVLAALLVAPGLFALSSLAFAVAVLVGQEIYLFFAMLLVPAGFLLTPLIIGIQAFTRIRR